MKIAFIGDVHGRIFHAISAILMWQIKNNEKLDMIIQVGDFGAYPEPDDEMLNNKFVLQDPTELDFSRYIKADLELQEDLKYARQQLNCPIHFIRGNHEDFQWLNAISQGGEKIAAVDNFDLIKYVPDGSIIEFKGHRITVLGGMEGTNDQNEAINDKVYETLLKSEPRLIDILVAHDSPYGTGVGFTGEIQGSKQVTELIKAIRPKYLISGHYHHMVGPKIIEETKYLGLNILIPPIRKDKERRVQPGSIGILDMDKGTLEFVEDEWLSEINKEFNFRRFILELKEKKIK